MKKTLIINVADGRRIERDLAQMGQIAPIGAPANHEDYAKVCQGIAMGGYTDVDKVTSKRLVYIAPSQIVSVEVEFK